MEGQFVDGVLSVGAPDFQISRYAGDKCKINVDTLRRIRYLLARIYTDVRSHKTQLSDLLGCFTRGDPTSTSVIR